MSTVGALTFLFSDIEGSTRRWEADEDGMRAALEIHDTLVAAAIEASSGTLFKHTGDGAAAVFGDAPDALRCAAAIQEAIDGAPWPGEALKVRIGVHSGRATERDGDWFGPTVSRTARIMDSAHGGQTVVSETTAALVRGGLPPELRLADLGEHRFKDLGERQRVLQLDRVGAETEFAPIRSLEAYETNLPSHLTSFVGREREVAEVLGMLETSRLTTLTGVGGVGKTRLALQVAADGIDRFPDGVWFVELAPVADTALILREIARVVGVREEAARPLMEVLLEHLDNKELLVVLDNCEHVIDEAAKIADDLLRSLPGLTILATSREGLGIGGERLWRVPSLAGADMAADIELFEERARLVRPDFTVDDANREVVRKICGRLDGIPLAIELAAARLKVFTPQQVAERLDDRFRLLTGGSRTALPRQRTLQATMDWSYDLLAEHEQAMLRALSVFYGGFTFEAAERVWAGDLIPEFEVLDLLTRLVESSLVLVDESGDHARYRLLETVRQYALDRLVEEQEADDARLRHAEHFAEWSSALEDSLLGPDSQQLLARCDIEHDNVRAALTWAIEAGRGTLAVALASGFGRYWFYRGFIDEGRDWSTRALLMAPEEPSDELLNVTTWGAAFALHQADFNHARSMSRRAVEVADALGSEEGVARAKVVLGNLELTAGDLSEAVRIYEEVAEWAEGAGSPYLSVPLVALGMAAAWMGDLDRARRTVDKLRDIAAADAEMEGWALTVEGWIAEYSGTGERAREAFERALDHVRAAKQRVLEGWALVGLAEAYRRDGDLDGAEALFAEGIAVGREIGAGSVEWLGRSTAHRIAMDRGDLAGAAGHARAIRHLAYQNNDLRTLARAAEAAAELTVAADGDPADAARLAGWARAVIDRRHEVLTATERTALDGVRETVSARLGSERAIAAEEDGASLDQAEISEVLDRTLGSVGGPR
jgi:predicted ATPase/class 3 adenylate cyclase